jgi:hypothetical protein
MHLLPLSLGRLAEHADRANVGRFATSCVFLRVNPDNTFEAVATDTKVLARVAGPCVDHSSAFPPSPEFAAKPDGGTTALIPADFWRTAFTWGRKLAGKSRGETPPPKCVAVRVGESETTFAAANEYYQWCESVENLAGRYPPYGEILDRAGNGPRDRVGLDPRLFGELLRTACDLQPDVACSEVVVTTEGPHRPVSVRSGQPGQLEFAGVLQPLDLGLSPLQDLTLLGQRCAELLAERDALAQEIEELKASLRLAQTSGQHRIA